MSQSVTQVTLGGTAYTIGKMRLGGIRQAPDDFAEVGSWLQAGGLPDKAGPTVIAAMVTAIYFAIRWPKDGTRPTLDAFREWMDDLDYDTGFSELRDAFNIAMLGNGFTEAKAAPGEPAAGAEASAGSSPASGSVGSTASLSPSPAGTIETSTA